MNANRYYRATLCSLILTGIPVQADTNWPVVAAFAGAAALIGGGVVHACHTSQRAQRCRARAEQVTVEDAVIALDCIEADFRTDVPEGRMTYRTLARNFAESDLCGLRDRLTALLARLDKVQRQLSQVIGEVNGDGGSALAQAQRAIHRISSLRYTIVAVHDVVLDLCRHKYEPLYELRRIAPFMHTLEYTLDLCCSDSDGEPIVELVRSKYASATAADGVKGFPLVCGAEDLRAQQQNVLRCIDLLEEHVQLVGRGDSYDAEVSHELTIARNWVAVLDASYEKLTNHRTFRYETTRYNEARLELRQLDAARARARESQAHAEAERNRTKRDLQAEYNRRDEIRLQQTRATEAVTNNLAHVASAVATTAALVAGARCTCEHGCSHCICERHCSEECCTHVRIVVHP